MTNLSNHVGIWNTDFTDLDAVHHIKGNYVFHFLKAAGINILDQNRFYWSQRELNESLDEAKSLDEFEELVRQ